MILDFKLFENNTLKLGDLVICTDNIDGLNTRNHVGYKVNYGIKFLNRFNDRLHNINDTISKKNGWFVDVKNMIPFESKKSETNLPLIYSKKFKDFIPDSLKFLLDYEHIYYSDISYVSTSDKNNMITCLSINNYKKLENKSEVWTTPLRQNMTIGRFLNKVISNEKRIVIEDYVNDYKFSFNLDKSDIGTFKKIGGEEMRKWYLEKNYAYGGGSLNQSCMRHDKSQKRLAIYTQNPEKLRMLIILNKEDKLIGRALLWKLDFPQNAFYMDRIYTVEDYINKFFIDYAKRMNFLTKEYVDKNKLTLRVHLKKDFGPATVNPFMDTFKFFVKKGNYLTNKFNNFKAGEYYEYVDHD